MKPTAVFFAFLLLSSMALAQSQSVEPQGEFADIDTSADTKAVEQLLKKRKSTIEKVLSKPNSYSPPVLYALSYALYERDRKDEAMFWFYLGQVRATSDARKSLDASAGQAVPVLNQQFGPNINQYAFLDLAKLRTTVEEVVTWDRENKRDYDPRWIALHGMQAFLGDSIPFEAPEMWPEIDEQTRSEYLEEFYSAVGRGEIDS